MKFNARVASLLLLSLSVLAQEEGAGLTNQSGSWSPYLAGGLIGVLLCASLYISNKPIGASSFYATVAGLVGKLIAPQHTKRLEYFKDNPPKVNWEIFFVSSIVLGGFIGALTEGEFSFRGLPKLWTNKYGANSELSYALLSIAGGFFMAFGARLSGGCTSGHGISGTSQLSVASWLSLACFFIGGVIMIQFIY